MADSSDAMLTALQALGLVPGATPLSSTNLVMQLVPRDESLQSKEVPVDALLGKIVSMRDKLRVLEQRVNASDISVDDKVQLEAQITAVYTAFSGLAAFFTEESLPTRGSGESAS